MNANYYLKLLQEQYLEDPQTIKKDLEYRKKRFEYIANRLNFPDLIEILSNFQNKTDDDYIKEAIFNPLLNSLPQEVSQKVSSIPIGTLPILEVNAHAIRVPNSGGKIIVIDRGLMMVLSKFSQAQAISSYILKRQKIERKNEFLFSVYKDILNHYSRVRNISDLEIPEMPSDFFLWSSLLTIGMESFICSHEIAHIYCGHLNDSKTISAKLFSREDISIDFYQKSKLQEYQADKLAWTWHQKFIPKDFSKSGENIKGMWLSAPFYLFILIEILEKNMGGLEKISTHPPAKLRMENLIKNTYANTKKSLHDKPFEFPIIFRTLLDTVPRFNMKP